jgi:hypothetical protein
VERCDWVQRCSNEPAPGESVGVPVDEKVVSSNVEPNIVVAVDGTTCTASQKRWDKAEGGSASSANGPGVDQTCIACETGQMMDTARAVSRLVACSEDVLNELITSTRLT